MKTIINKTELMKIYGGKDEPTQDTSAQYDLGYLIGLLLTTFINYNGYVATTYGLAFK